MIETAFDRRGSAKALGLTVETFSEQIAAGLYPPPHHLDDGLEYWWEHELANSFPTASLPDKLSRWAYPCVYFIGARVSPYVKVGWAKHVPKRRLELQCANPERLVVLGSAPGDLKDEKRLHRALAAHRAHGEWFHKGPWLDAVLAYLAQPAMFADELVQLLEKQPA